MTRQLIGGLLSLLLVPAFALADPGSTGFNPNTVLVGPDGDNICPGSIFQENIDGSYENGYAWSSFGVEAPYYGAWAECYESDFVCGVQFAFTQTGGDFGQLMDVYVWDDDAGNPGNVLCMIGGVDPEPIAFWPSISTHQVQVCCDVAGSHFVGWWGDWPGAANGWFIASDEDGLGGGCPRTNIAPGIGYPTGWQHPSIVGTFGACQDLGIAEFSGEGDCQPTPAEETTWGRIKALY